MKHIFTYIYLSLLIVTMAMSDSTQITKEQHNTYYKPLVFIVMDPVIYWLIPPILLRIQR